MLVNKYIAPIEGNTLLVHPSNEPAKRTSEAGVGHTILIFRRLLKTLWASSSLFWFSSNNFCASLFRLHLIKDCNMRLHICTTGIARHLIYEWIKAYKASKFQLKGKTPYIGWFSSMPLPVKLYYCFVTNIGCCLIW